MAREPESPAACKNPLNERGEPAHEIIEVRKHE
jgi:hypothetical protein